MSSRPAAARFADVPNEDATASAIVSAAAAEPPEVPSWLQGRLKIFYPLYRAFELWSDADGLRMSAAMSFYGILSLAPLLVLIVGLLGWWIDREVLETSLVQQIGGVVGQRGAEVIQAAIDSARQPGQGLIASLLAFGLLLVGATGVFAELQSALERLWTQGTGVAAVDAWWHTATLRLRGVAYILAFGFLMLVSTLISSLLGLLESWASTQFDMKLTMAVVNQVVSFLITTALFVGLMRISAGPQPSLRYLVRGAAVGALMFGVGKYALALYLSTAAVVSAYGAAGSLVVLLMWIYFAAAVLLFGAAVARVMAEASGQFSAAPVPPPAAAVTAAQGELRKAGDEEAARSGAAVAAVLSELTPSPAQAGETPAPGLRLALAEQAMQDRPAATGWLSGLRSRLLRADDESHEGSRAADGIALAVSLAAAYWLTRQRDDERAADATAAARQRLAKDADQLRAAQRDAARQVQAHGPRSKWLALGAVALRGLHALSDQAARSAERLGPQARSSGRWRAPRAVAEWGERAAVLQAGRAGVLWKQWRERQALASARRTVAQDVQALRDALRARR